MRNNTRFKKLLDGNKLIIENSGNGRDIDMIVTNKNSGNSHMVTGRNITELMNKAYTDTIAASKNGSVDF